MLRLVEYSRGAEMKKKISISLIVFHLIKVKKCIFHHVTDLSAYRQDTNDKLVHFVHTRKSGLGSVDESIFPTWRHLHLLS